MTKPDTKRRYPPYKSTSLSKICRLKRDGVHGKEGWSQINGPDEIVLCNQVSGKKSTGEVAFSFATFTEIARWWLGEIE